MKNPNRLLYLLAIIGFILPFLIIDPTYELHRDEYLYLEEGKHLAWGFMEIPPLLPFFSWISQAMGASMFWVKCWPALFGSLTFLLMGKLILHLGGRHFAVFLTFLPFVCTGFLRLFFLFQPNFLDTFFWTLSAYTIVRFIQTQHNSWLYVFGIATGLGLLSKYSMAFYTISLLVGLLFTTQRNIFRNKHLYLSAGITLLMMLPNIWWQYQHNFPLLAHMNELKETQLKFNDAGGFLMDQVMMLLSCILIWVAGWVYLFFHANAKPYRAIGWSYVAVIALLAYLNGKSYYAAGVYPILFAFGAYYLERITKGKIVWRILLPGISLSMGLFTLPLLLPTKPAAELAQWYERHEFHKMGSFKWEDQQYHPLPQDFSDMIGWRELAERTAAVYHALPDTVKEKTLIYCRGYFTAGALNYHAKELGLPQVHSDNASFLLWMPDQYSFKHLMLIDKRMPKANDIVFQQFKKVTVMDSITIPLFRETGMRVILFENGNDSVNVLTERGIAGMKARFSRKAK